jgi:hypothetical protein
MKTEYLVVNENTLVYRQPGDKMVGVLGGKPQLGGKSNNPLEAPFHLSPLDNVRPATKEDFDFFRVSSAGYDL